MWRSRVFLWTDSTTGIRDEGVYNSQTGKYDKHLARSFLAASWHDDTSRYSLGASVQKDVSNQIQSILEKSIPLDPNYTLKGELLGFYAQLEGLSRNTSQPNETALVSGQLTWNAAIGGTSAAYQGLSLSSGVTLDVSAVDTGAGLTIASGNVTLGAQSAITGNLVLNEGTLSLGGQNTMTGNLTLGTGLFIDASRMTPNGNALLALTGALTVNGSLLLENADGVSWSAGTYNLISATEGVTGDLANTILLGTQYMGNWDTADNVLKFVVTELTSISWTGGGDSTWTVGGSGANSPWSAGDTFENGKGVSFGDIASNPPQTVNIAGQVNPGLILVNAESTDYTWTGTGSLTGSGKLQKTGNGTLTIATDNSGFSGEVLLGGGLVEIQNAGALGTGDIVFNGGALKYGTGITADISGQLKTDALASNAILVDTSGNAVTWASLAGWAGTLTRSGEGSLMLGAGTYEGKLTNEGAGSLIIGAGNASLAGGIGGTVSKTGDGTLTINRNAFTNSNGSTLVVESGTLSLIQNEGAWTGTMNIVLGDNVTMNVPYGVGVNGTGTLTMGGGTTLNLSNGNGSSNTFNMNIVLDAGEGLVSLRGSVNGNKTSVGSTISGTGNLRITHLNNGSNNWKFSGGWVKNSYDGNTEIIATDKQLSLTYDIGSASVTGGQTVTPWGQGDVTIGGGANTMTVTFSGVGGTAASNGISLDGNITLKGANAATRLNIFAGSAGTMTLNGLVSVETSGTGTADGRRPGRNGNAGGEYQKQRRSPDTGRRCRRIFRNAESDRFQPVSGCGYGFGRNAERLFRQSNRSANPECDRNSECRLPGR